MDGALRIEICGGIASGKTSLAALLPKLGLSSAFENFRANPFFSDFYTDPTTYAFETEITFLLQHFNLIKSSQLKVAESAFDFSLALDLAYAEVTLSREDLLVFRTVLDAVITKIGLPNLLIRLQCSRDEEIARIRRRGREQEQRIERSYLERLESALTNVLGSALFSRTAILEIDSQRTNFVSDSGGIAEVSEVIMSELVRARQRVPVASDSP
jgi:deoxyguanosine kinase